MNPVLPDPAGETATVEPELVTRRALLARLARAGAIAPVAVAAAMTLPGKAKAY